MSKDKANERISGGSGNHKEKKSHMGLVVVLAVLVIVVLIFVIIFLVARDESDPITYNNIVTPDNVDEIISQLEEQERTPVGSYEVSMNLNWEFENGDAVSSNAYVENSVSNQNTVYFTISLDGSDELIYTSPYLEVGSYLKDIKLDASLDSGNYDAVITYHLVDGEYNELSAVSLFMQIVINQ